MNAPREAGVLPPRPTCPDLRLCCAVPLAPPESAAPRCSLARAAEVLRTTRRGSSRPLAIYNRYRARAADRRSERVSPSSSRSPRGSCTRRARTPQPAQGALIRLIVNVVLYVGGWCDAHDAPPRSSLGPRSSSAVLARKLAREGGSGGEEEAHRHPHRAVRHRDCR